MNPLIFIYNEFLWRPLFNGLVWFYTVLPGQDLGLAIIALTIVIRLILFVPLLKAQKAQRGLALLQPEIKKIQEQFKNDKAAQGKALTELYARHNLNPFSGCLIMLLQLPILIALFNVFRSGLEPSMLSYLYSFVPDPGRLDPVSFNLIDLSKGNIYLGVPAALSQFWQTKLTVSPSTPPKDKNNFSQAMQWQMTYVLPALILVWSYTLPSALTLYWTTLNIFGIVQEVLAKPVKKIQQL